MDLIGHESVAISRHYTHVENKAVTVWCALPARRCSPTAWPGHDVCWMNLSSER